MSPSLHFLLIEEKLICEKYIIVKGCGKVIQIPCLEREEGNVRVTLM
jgi:hypothetical protein